MAPTELATTKDRILKYIHELETTVKRLEARDREAIAIVGMAGRFPGAPTIEAFWNLLKSGTDPITVVPKGRWDVDAHYDPNPDVPGKSCSRFGGFLEHIDLFDRRSFGISMEEAEAMDPQQRLALEATWEALDDAGLSRHDPVFSRCGVFMGTTGSTYAERLRYSQNRYIASGNFSSMVANRVSYVFNAGGPSVAVDTACSSSLVAIHLACMSLLRGESDVALAGGVNCIASPHLSSLLSRMHMFSPEGKCKTFDGAANGFVFSEGCGVLVLKRLSDAISGGDRIWAVIRGSASNQDGYSGGLTVPSGRAQEAVVRLALANARLPPSAIQYIEAHGTGTALGDPIEVLALREVFRGSDVIGLGSVKSVIGHTAAAAGVAGVIKVILALTRRMLPPNLHFRNPNPHIPFDTLPFRVQDTFSPWPRPELPLIAGVSSFGLGGTNAHIVLSDVAATGLKPQPRSADRADGVPFALPLSAPTADGLLAQATEYGRFLAAKDAAEEPVSAALRDIAYTAAVRRTHFRSRLCVVGKSTDDWARKLRDVIRELARDELVRENNARVGLEESRSVVFVYCGQGSHWWGMGRDLFRDEEVFAEQIRLCAKHLDPLTGWSLVTEGFERAQGESRFDDTEVVQPLIFALQEALTALWKSWGVSPALVIGHSVGEIAAARAAGVLSLEEACRLVAHRGKAAQATKGQGAMAAVELSHESAVLLTEQFAGKLAVAAINSPNNCTLSGDVTAIRSVVADLLARNIRAKILPGEYGFHGPAMRPCAGRLRQWVQRLEVAAPSVPILPTGAAVTADKMDIEYWERQLQEPVLFEDAIRRAMEEGHTTFLEIGPRPVLSPMIKDTLAASQRRGSVLFSMDSRQLARECLLDSTAALYRAGQTIQWKNLFPGGGAVVSLPAYRFQRERCWIEETIPRGEGVVAVQRAADTEVPQREALPSESNSWGYGTQWREEQALQEGEECPGPTHQLVFCAARESVKELGSGPRSQGAIRVFAGASFREIEKDVFEINPRTAADFDRLVDAALGGPDGARNLTSVLFCWPLDVLDAEGGVALERAVDLGPVALLLLVQSLARHGETPRIWCLTSGAQSLQSAARPVRALQALAWGLGATVANEFPSLRLTLLDLDPDHEAESCHLAARVSATATAETRLAIRAGAVHSARLRRISGLGRNQGRLGLKNEGTYIVLANALESGRDGVRFLAGRGMRDVELFVQPSGCVDPTTELDPSARVRTIDLADTSALLTAVRDVIAKHGSVRGVLAIVPAQEQQRMLLAQDPDELRTDIKRTLSVYRNVGEISQQVPLDFVCILSSVEHVFGNLARAHGAIADAYAIALVEQRALHGVPAFHIGLGSAEGADEDAPVSLSQALSLRFTANPKCLLTLRVRWPRWKEANAALAALPFFGEVATLPDDAQMSDHATTRRIALLALPGERRVAYVESYLKEMLAQILSMDEGDLDYHRPLSEVGLDSLLFTRLRSRIEQDLEVLAPSDSVFKYPTIAQLAQFVVDSLTAEARSRTSGAEVNNTLVAGAAWQTTTPISPAMGTQHLGALAPAILSTAALVTLLELACCEMLVPHYGAGKNTVGYGVSIRHMAPANVGERVTCRVNLKTIMGRHLQFEVKAFRQDGTMICEGTHDRALVNENS